MDEALILARVQFGLNIGFHILFPTITIGLAWVLVYLRVRVERAGAADRDAWLATYKLWVKIFALTFAMGVVSGVTMSFQFGTNWPGYMNTVGNIAGPLLAYEVLTAFFLEATFLGIMLFGMNRVPGWVHLLSTVMVAFGTTVSAFWILALNSWMQTPAGHVVVDGEIIAGSWLAVIFNPSFPYRLTHMLLASGITAAFLVAGLSAWRLLKAPGDAAATRTLRLGAHIAAVLVPLQIVVGDLHGLNTLKHQPAKVAAMEAQWKTEKGAALTLFGIPDDQIGHTSFAVTIPKALSLILTHDPDGEVKGLEEFGEDIPPVAPVFFAFRVMVGVGVLMLLLSWVGTFKMRKSGAPRWLLWAFAGFTFSGWVATLAGWLVTEIGRQPWLVTGILYTADAVGEASGGQLGASLTAYVLTYAALLLSYMVVITHLAGARDEMSVDLPLVFTVLMGMAILAYVVLDGYDLGVGMLMPAAGPDEQNRMVASIGPFWDANETWLVLGIGLLLVAFPLAHGVILGALYLPVAAMLVGLMLRGVAFELRIKAEGWHRELWNWLFWAGSTLAAFAQGLMLGRFITGFADSAGAWLFAVLVGASLCGGYVLLGATWLVLRTDGPLQEKSIAWARWGLMWVALGVALVSAATPLASQTVSEKWFDFPRTLGLMLLPALTLYAGIFILRNLGRSDWKPFAGAVAIYVLAFLGLAYSLFPYVVMDRLTIWEAAAHDSALSFVLVGTLIVLPFIVAYTVYVYRVFRGKAAGNLYD